VSGDETGKPVTACHFPSGASKLDKTGHRLPSFVSAIRRARPLTSFEKMISLIRNTRTATGLTVTSLLHSEKHETAVRVSGSVFKGMNIRYLDFQGDWDYSICQRNADPPQSGYPEVKSCFPLTPD
jgi:hypothetical protein